MKLYLAYLGGRLEGVSIEAHDCCFVVAENITAAVRLAKEKWAGKSGSAHIDAIREVTRVGEFGVTVSPTPDESASHLFFVNIGFYRRGAFGESHDISLVVAESKDAACRQALAGADADAVLVHRDNLFAVDDCIRVSSVDSFHVRIDRTPPDAADHVFYGPTLQQLE